MSFNLFGNLSSLDPSKSIKNLGDSLEERGINNVGLGGLPQSLRRQADWYSGPGGESATKIYLAALASIAGGSVLGMGSGAGAGAGTGGTEGGSLLGGGEVANSGMDFGGEGVGWSQNQMGGVNPNSSPWSAPSSGYDVFKSMAGQFGKMGQAPQQGQPKPMQPLYVGQAPQNQYMRGFPWGYK